MSQLQALRHIYLSKRRPRKGYMQHNYNSDTFLSGMWSCVDLRMDTHVMNVSKRDWTMCSNYANHSRFNSQHILGGVYMTIQGAQDNEQDVCLVSKKSRGKRL